MATKGSALRQGGARSVLVLKPSSLGDIVHTLPAVAWMKARRPAWRFSWLVNTEWRPLLEGNPALEEIIEFPRREFRGVAGARRLLPWLREHVVKSRPDLALDFQGLLRTALIGRLSGAGDFRGLADAREGARWFYDRAAPPPPGAPHAVERYLALAADALGEDAGRTPDALRFPLPDGEPPEGMADLLQEWGAFVLLHPFSRGQGKSLTPEQVHGLCRRLAPRRVVLAGRMAGASDFTSPPDCCNLLDRTSLGQLLWLIRRAGFVISVDSGPMHLAAALDRPLVGIHTWSDPRRVGPHRADAWVWKSGRLVRVKDFSAMDPAFFEAGPEPLSEADLDAIGVAALAGMDGK